MSGNATDIVYWDTCIFYALFKGETMHGPGVLEGICAEYDAFLNGKIKLITSTIAIAEIAAGNFPDPAGFQRFKDLRFAKGFEFCSPTFPIMETTSKLKDFYWHNPFGDKQQFKHLQLGDALHLATAIEHGAHHFVTLDGKNKPKESAIGLLNITNPVAGLYSANIRAPIPPAPKTQPKPVESPADFVLRQSEGPAATT